jgi:hypothetical protein
MGVSSKLIDLNQINNIEEEVDGKIGKRIHVVYSL